MSSFTSIIYANELSICSTIAELLNGSGPYTVPNRFFQKAGVFDAKMDDLRTPAFSNSYGIRLNGRVLIKDPKTGSFSRTIKIGWRSNKSREPKKYSIIKPYLQTADAAWTKTDIACHVKSRDTDAEEDTNLLMMDYQICMACEVLIVAESFGVDISKYEEENDNLKLLNGICSVIQEKLTAANPKAKISQKLEVSKELADSFLDPPSYKHKKNSPWIALAHDNLDTNKPLFLSLIMTVKTFIENFNLKYKYPKAFEACWTNAGDTSVIPSIRRDVYENKQDEFVDPLSAKLIFKTMLDKEDKGFKQTIPIGVYTKICIGLDASRKPINKVLTKEMLANLWGNTLDNIMGKQTKFSYEGVIFLRYQLDLKYYATGNPSTKITVDKLSVSSRTKEDTDYDDGAEFAPMIGGSLITSRVLPTQGETDEADEENDVDMSY